MSLITKRREDLFVREDNNGQYTILIKDSQRQLYLNKSGWDIFNNCYKFNNFNDLLQDYKSRYSDVDEKLLKKDLISTLRIFEIYGLTEKDCTDEIEQDFLREGITFAGDLHYKTIEEFINQNKSNESSYFDISKKNDYSALALRMKSMTNSEYYVLNIHNREINFVISLIPPNHNLSPNVINISSLFTNLNNESEIVNIMNKVVDFLNSQIETPINKLRFNCLRSKMNSSKTKKVIELLVKSGFIFECELNREIGDDNLLIYSKFYD